MKKHRKLKPNPPPYWAVIDACWCCDKKTKCGKCKFSKEAVAEQKNRQERREKKEFKRLCRLDSPREGAL